MEKAWDRHRRFIQKEEERIEEANALSSILLRRNEMNILMAGESKEKRKKIIDCHVSRYAVAATAAQEASMHWRKIYLRFFDAYTFLWTLQCIHK